MSLERDMERAFQGVTQDVLTIGREVREPLRRFWPFLLALALLAGAYYYLAFRTHAGLTGAALIVGLVLLVFARIAGRRLVRAHRRNRIRARWEDAVRAVKLPPTRVEHVDVGRGRLTVRVGGGIAVDDLGNKVRQLEAALGERLRIEYDRDHPGRAFVILSPGEPFAGGAKGSWPGLREEKHSLWDPVPFGVDEYGESVSLSLVGRHILVGGMTGGGKALDVDTPVPTPDGWTTMGDLRKGHKIFDERGELCRVTHAWPIRLGRPCYEIVFDDGSVIVADADHQWVTETHLDRCGRRPGTVISTQVLRDTLRYNRRSNHSIPCASPLSGKQRRLPVPPYAFGCWLGDGTSRGDGFATADPEIARYLAPERVELRATGGRYGYQLRYRHERQNDSIAICACGTMFLPKWRGQVRCEPKCAVPVVPRRRERTFYGDLRDLGVIRNKHIPIIYLRSSVEQRRALLAGLLDTDGTCAVGRSVTYYSTRKQLASDVYHLVASLGYKPNLRTRRVRGRSEETSTCYSITFAPEEEVFRLSRKRVLQAAARRSTTRRRYVVDVRPVASVPVRCIAVDSPSHQFLVGEACIATHNSVALSAICAAAANDPDAKLYLFDPKRLELAIWERCAAGSVDGPDLDRATSLLREVRRELDRRTALLKAQAEAEDVPVRMIPRDPSMPLCVVIIDELAEYTDRGRDSADFSNILRSLVAMGRAVGIIVVAATQKPQGSVVPTELRDLFPYRFALRCGTPQMSETILGQGWASRGADASRLPDRPGLGFLLADEALPRRVRTFALSDEDLASLALRARERRLPRIGITSR